MCRFGAAFYSASTLQSLGLKCRQFGFKKFEPEPHSDTQAVVAWHGLNKGDGMFEVLSWLAILIAIAAIIGGGVLYARGAFAGGGSPFFRPKIAPRIDVVEHTAIDAKRRLVLIRRDAIEHLIMTGGPVDVVIETGISPPQRPSVEMAETDTAQSSMFTTAPVGFGARAERPPRMAMFTGRRAPPVSVAETDDIATTDDRADLATLKADRI